MKPDRAKEIICALADGRDPATGQQLPTRRTAPTSRTKLFGRSTWPCPLRQLLSQHRKGPRPMAVLSFRRGLPIPSRREPPPD